MKKTDLLSTLFVGIDISSRSNVVALLDFESQKPLRTFSVANNQPGAMELAQQLYFEDFCYNSFHRKPFLFCICLVSIHYRVQVSYCFCNPLPKTILH